MKHMHLRYRDSSTFMISWSSARSSVRCIGDSLVSRIKGTFNPNCLVRLLHDHWILLDHDVIHIPSPSLQFNNVQNPEIYSHETHFFWPLYVWWCRCMHGMRKMICVYTCCRVPHWVPRDILKIIWLRSPPISKHDWGFPVANTRPAKGAPKFIVTNMSDGVQSTRTKNESCINITDILFTHKSLGG